MTAPHLGGHFGTTNADPAVLAYLQERHGVRTMLDVGCGPGGMRAAAEVLGIAWEGVDGDPACAGPGVLIHDYTGGGLWWSAVDLVWCVEFVEHVTARYIPNYLATFEAGRVLLVTHALPGQGGHHHVNEQPPSYWREVLSRAGWREDAEATAWVQANADDQYVRRTGMVWTR